MRTTILVGKVWRIDVLRRTDRIATYRVLVGNSFLFGRLVVMNVFGIVLIKALQRKILSTLCSSSSYIVIAFLP